jgi:hypothetical protein
MGNPTEERLRLQYQRARKSYAVKTRPIKDIEYLEGIHELAVERKSEADAIWMEYNHRVRPILDEFGFVGSVRIMYYDFGRQLLSFFLRFSENMWHSFIEGLKTHYVVTYKLDPKCLDKIVEMTIAYAKEVKEGPVVGEDGGQEA